MADDQSGVLATLTRSRVQPPTPLSRDEFEPRSRLVVSAYVALARGNWDRLKDADGKRKMKGRMRVVTFDRRKGMDQAIGKG